MNNSTSQATSSSSSTSTSTSGPTTTTIMKRNCSEITEGRLECEKNGCFYNPNPNNSRNNEDPVCQDKEPGQECPSDTSNLVCKDTGKQKLVGKCQDNTFLPLSVCNSKMDEICSEYKEAARIPKSLP